MVIYVIIYASDGVYTRRVCVTHYTLSEAYIKYNSPPYGYLIETL